MSAISVCDGWFFNKAFANPKSISTHRRFALLRFFFYPPLFSAGRVLGCFFVSGFALGLVRVLKRLGKAGEGGVWLEKAAFDKLRFHCLFKGNSNMLSDEYCFVAGLNAR